MAKVLDGNYCDKSKPTANKINRNDYDDGDQVPW
jgi:hypothetical protein